MPPYLMEIVNKHFSPDEAAVIEQHYADYWTEYGNISTKRFIKNCRAVLQWQAELFD